MEAVLKIAIRIPPETADAKIAAAVGMLAATLSGDAAGAYVHEPVQEPTLLDRALGRDHYIREVTV